MRREADRGEEVLDRQTLEEYGRMTGGLDAHHALAPDEIAMLFEEGIDDDSEWDKGRDELREEVFSGVCVYTMADGVHPQKVMERMRAMMERFGSDTLKKMTAATPVWWDEDAVRNICRKFEEAQKRTGAEDAASAFLLSVSKKIREERDEFFVFQCFRLLIRQWICEGACWKKAVGVHLGMIKYLRPSLMTVMERRNGQDVPVMMSLDDIAVLCGDAGKATVSARIKRVFNRKLEAQGMLGCFAHFQKSPEAVEKYRAAQRGNTNRRRKQG
jgi:hypothetical protein